LFSRERDAKQEQAMETRRRPNILTQLPYRQLSCVDSSQINQLRLPPDGLFGRSGCRSARAKSRALKARNAAVASSMALRPEAEQLGAGRDLLLQP
jgi:hypothetical protein